MLNFFFDLQPEIQILTDSNKGAAKRINKMLPKNMDGFIDDFEAELLVSDTNFKIPKDKELDDDLNAKQMYHRYSGKYLPESL